MMPDGDRLNLLFVADGRSPITMNWLGYLVDQGHSIHLVSTYPCSPYLGLASLRVLPVAFGGMAGGPGMRDSSPQTGLPGIAKKTLRKALPVGIRTRLRQWFGPLSLPGAARRLKEIVLDVKPDLVHAMRIPYEGMLAALAELPVPLVVSVWGNDFTLHASSTPLMRRYTRLAVCQAQGLHVDCWRDLRLAQSWGYPPEALSVVLPTSGGVQTDTFFPLHAGSDSRQLTVVNPRGLRAYIRSDAFFRSIPLVLSKHPGVRFECPAMAGEPLARHWVRDLGVSESVHLLPRQSRPQMAGLFRRSQVVVSPSTHDGAPNSLLEAMSCGCFPVVGDLESLREWILPGVNGLLVDPGDPFALAEAINIALESPELRESAAGFNSVLIAERAEYRRTMAEAEHFYRQIIG